MAVQDATVSGALEVSGAKAVLVGSSVVVAKDHSAEITLSRGGVVLVCQTSGLHLAQGGAAKGTGVAVAPLLLALDRGAVEIRMAGLGSDVVMTPDMRLSLVTPGALDLRLRVTRNGDTCIENRGAKAPVLTILAQFGDASYQLQPGQHVLFEHGNLREVVDHEASECGCPTVPTVSIAEALLAPGAGPSTPAVAAVEHPFPDAVSAGLAPPPMPPQARTGAANAEVAMTLSAEGDGVGGKSATPAATSAVAAETQKAAAAPSTPPTPPAGKGGVARSVGRFFKRLFGRG